MKVYFGIKMVYVWILPSLFLPSAFETDMIMPLWSADLYIQYGRLCTECLSGFALLSPSESDLISGTYKLWTLSGRDPSSERVCSHF